jgi:hypothetical protein
MSNVSPCITYFRAGVANGNLIYAGCGALPFLSGEVCFVWGPRAYVMSLVSLAWNHCCSFPLIVLNIGGFTLNFRIKVQD